MEIVVQIEHRASSRRGKHEGEPSFGLCDRLSRTRDNSQRQLPTDQDYAVPTREYQTDQSSLKTAPTAARSVLEQRRKQQQKQTHRSHTLTRSLHIRPMRSLSLGWRPGLVLINALLSNLPEPRTPTVGQVTEMPTLQAQRPASPGNVSPCTLLERLRGWLA
jgi:hypothetical protein